jgi:TRAP-type C4-dicarboxylate transport system permease small subunit
VTADRLARWLRRVERAVGWLVAALVLALLVVVALQLVDRHALDVGIAAPDQYVRIGLVWLTFVGFALAISEGANVRIEFVEQHLPPRWRRALAILFDVAILALCVFLVVKGWRVVEVGAGQTILGTPFTSALPNTGFVVGMGLTALMLALRIARTLLGGPAAPAAGHAQLAPD